ncbi:MAG: CHAT domain-containing protein, partial [Acidobacteriota bacterium]|nr:CHAT domain-containing protein [Acidobacteriota bacterium]
CRKVPCRAVSGKDKKKEIEQDRALQGKLKNWGEGTVALSTIIGEDRYRVILTTANAQIDGKTEIKAADLNAKIFAFREALLNPTIDPKPLGKELYDILIKPIEKDLDAGGAKTLLWSLDGTLRYIPIAALFDGKQYLVQKYQNVIVTSTTRQSLQAEVVKNWNILGAGVTKASEITDANTAQKFSFDELKSVAKELSAVVGDDKNPKNNSSTGVSLLDAAFTENALKEQLTQTAADKRKFNVVHFATHFRLGSDTADSFLLLGNNKTLTLAEVADSPEMNLTDVELVTLSACNTGFGGLENSKTLTENNGKEVDSLAQFIELRGAKSVMATLWSVADESTSILMGEFYRLQRENQNWTKAETLRQAQLELLYGKYKPEQANEKNRSDAVRFGASAKNMPKFIKDENAPFAHPFYWSPFVLIGNWR